MARSTLFALLVLVLIQVALAVPYGRSLIINRAANGALKGDPHRVLTVSRDDLHTKPWAIERYEEGALIVALGPEPLFISAHRGRAVLAPLLQKWSFENAGENSYKIKLPYEDQVLTWDEMSSEVRLQPADGAPEQLWEIRRAFDYGRMYRQY